MNGPINALPVSTDVATNTVTITLEANQGPMTVLDASLIHRLEAAIRLVPGNTSGLVLASGSPRVFVAGADLKAIESMAADELDRYLTFGQRVFGMIAALPCPTVAAINGAALGGGLELAMHCDGIVAAPAPSRDGQPPKPYPIGLPEAGLSICPGWGGTNLLPARLDPMDALRRTATGATMPITEAVPAGLVDEMAPSPEELLPTARRWLLANRHIHAGRRDGQPLKWIGRVNRKASATAAFIRAGQELARTDSTGAVLRAVQAGLELGWPAALAVERAELIRLRSAPAGRAAIQAFFNKSAAVKKA